MPHVYKQLSIAYPDSLFILSIRDSSKQWYNSYVSFIEKGIKEKSTKANLLKNKHLAEISRWEVYHRLFNLENEDHLVQENLENYYNKHTIEVINYFKQSNNYLVINVSIPDDYQRLVDFLNQHNFKVSSKRKGFTWENRTSNLRDGFMLP